MTDARTTAPTTAVVIRRATPADATEVAAMVREIAAHEDQAAHVHVPDEQWHGLLQRPEVVVLLAERHGAPVGYVSAIRQLHLWTGGDVLIRRGGEVDNIDARRFSHRLGATLRPKILPAWPPAAYAGLGAGS